MSQWQEVAVCVHQEAEEAVSAMLLRRGAQGVAIEAHGVSQVVVKGYLAAPETKDQLETLLDEVHALADYGLAVGEVSVTERIIEEQDWAHAWKAYYHTDKVGQVVIQPSWESYTPEPGETVIQLDPGMAFGTGSHPTTRMCIQALQEIPLETQIVWDVGTGSGILAILAAKLGAASVIAVDVDPVAVDVAQKNCAANETVVSVQQGTIQDLPQQADVIVANIIADVIEDMLPDVMPRLRPRGLFLASGVIAHRAEGVRDCAQKHGFSVVRKMGEGEWAAFVFQRER